MNFDFSDEQKLLQQTARDYLAEHSPLSTCREILESDLIHVRRADGRDLDAWLHVNPRAEERALAMVFNPLDREATRSFDFQLYFAGLKDRCIAREHDGVARELVLDEQQRATLELRLPPHGFTWIVFSAAK